MNRGVGVNGFIVKKGKFLLVKRSENDKFLPGDWEIPGGKLELGETAEEGVMREVLEETGLDVEVSSIISNWEYEHNSNQTRYVQLDFLCKAQNNQEVQLSNEHSDYTWVTFDELKNYKMSREVRDDLLKIHKHPLVEELIDSRTTF